MATAVYVYESSAWGFNLQGQLTGAGIECIVAHAGDISGQKGVGRQSITYLEAGVSAFGKNLNFHYNNLCLVIACLFLSLYFKFKNQPLFIKT